MDKEELYKKLLPLFKSYLEQIDSINKNDIEFVENPDIKDFFNFLPTLVKYLRQDIEGLSIGMKVGTMRFGKDSNEYAIFNAILFFKISFLDICFIQQELAKTKNIFERGVYARILALNLYEFFNDVHDIFFGKGNDKNLSKLTFNFANIKISERLKHFLRLLSKMKSKTDVELRSIRNSTIAHKDKDALKQLDVLDKIDFKWLHQCTFFVWYLWLYYFIELEKDIHLELFPKKKSIKYLSTVGLYNRVGYNHLFENKISHFF